MTLTIKVVFIYLILLISPEEQEVQTFRSGLHLAYTHRRKVE